MTSPSTCAVAASPPRSAAHEQGPSTIGRHAYCLASTAPARWRGSPDTATPNPCGHSASIRESFASPAATPAHCVTRTPRSHPPRRRTAAYAAQVDLPLQTTVDPRVRAYIAHQFDQLADRALSLAERRLYAKEVDADLHHRYESSPGGIRTHLQSVSDETAEVSRGASGCARSESRVGIYVTAHAAARGIVSGRRCPASRRLDRGGLRRCALRPPSDPRFRGWSNRVRRA